MSDRKQLRIITKLTSKPMGFQLLRLQGAKYARDYTINLDQDYTCSGLDSPRISERLVILRSGSGFVIYLECHSEVPMAIYDYGGFLAKEVDRDWVRSMGNSEEVCSSVD